MVARVRHGERAAALPLALFLYYTRAGMKLTRRPRVGPPRRKGRQDGATGVSPAPARRSRRLALRVSAATASGMPVAAATRRPDRDSGCLGCRPRAESAVDHPGW